jgi:hypothetical protein
MIFSPGIPAPNAIEQTIYALISSYLLCQAKWNGV